MRRAALQPSLATADPQKRRRCRYAGTTTPFHAAVAAAPGKGVRVLGDRLMASAERYIQDSLDEKGSVVQRRAPRALLEDWKLLDVLRGNRDGVDAERVVQIVEEYWAASTRVHDPRFVAHQVAVAHPISALGDFAHGITNNGHATYEMGPQAVAMELAMVSWMLNHVGWPGGGGVLVDGGSIGNLTCLLGARAAAFPDAWERGVPSGAKLFAPVTSHYSVARCAGILGIGTDAVVAIPADPVGKIIPEGLDRALAAARAAGDPILAVCANACATATGLYDPLRLVGEICRRHGVWLHVDGCHGASVLLSDDLKGLVDGIDLADSVCWDAHKMLEVSAVCAGALFRDPEAVYRSFRQDGNYLAGTKRDEKPFLRTIECTRGGLGLKAFLVLALLGERGVARDLERMHAHAHYLHRYLLDQPDFVVPFAPESNILLFQPLRKAVDNPSGVLADFDVETIRRRLMDAGSYYLSAANFAGRKWLRVTLINPATSEAHLRAMVEAVREEAARVATKSAASA